MISIEHGVNVIHYISHVIWADDSSITKFVIGAQKLKVFLVFADSSYMVRGGNWIAMLFG